MHARRSRFRPARLLAIFMALLSLAVAILWADSYRERGPNRTKLEPPRFIPATFTIPGSGRKVSSPFGLEERFATSDENGIWYRTDRGRFILRYEPGGWTIDQVQPLERSWGDFAYKQREFTFTIKATPNGGPKQILAYRLREISAPFWALFVLCAAYPTIYFVRGPMRRRKRRRRGQCIECGYDLRGSADKCPECGAQVIGPRGSCAAGVAGSSHAVIDGENAPSE